MVIINRTQIELEIATQNVSFRRKVIVCNNAKHGHVLKLHFATTHTMVSILCTKSGFIPYLILIRKRGHTQVSLFQKLTPHLALFQCMAWVIDRRLKYLKMRPRWNQRLCDSFEAIIAGYSFYNERQTNKNYLNIQLSAVKYNKY